MALLKQDVEENTTDNDKLEKEPNDSESNGEDFDTDDVGDLSGGANKLTATPDTITEKVLDNVKDPNLKDDIVQVVNDGMTILFGDKTHKTIFDSIRPRDQVPLANELGAGAVNIMTQMYDASTQKNDPIPEAAIIPAGAILLAAVCDHINVTGIDNTTDETYADALEMFIRGMQDKLDPNFRKDNNIPPSPAQMQMAQQAQDQVPQGADAAAAIGPGAQAAPGLLQGA